MRPITRRLRIFAAVLGLAHGGVLALALAHELAGADSGAPVAHTESQGATHDVAAHSHECGICRNTVAKFSLPAHERLAIRDGSNSRRLFQPDRLLVARSAEGSEALPRGPPVG